ncbi:MAG: hypothetical protein NVS9B1_14930 [Candidatus Dormibacteraceae bacterium]
MAHGAHDRHRRQGGRRQSCENRLDHGFNPQTALQVKAGGPADLKVVDVLSRRVDAELVGTAFERGGRLENRDLGIEAGDVLGLGGTARRRGQAQRPGQVELQLVGELGGGGGPNRTVQMAVQFGLPPAFEISQWSGGR